VEREKKAEEQLCEVAVAAGDSVAETAAAGWASAGGAAEERVSVGEG